MRVNLPALTCLVRLMGRMQRVALHENRVLVTPDRPHLPRLAQQWPLMGRSQRDHNCTETTILLALLNPIPCEKNETTTRTGCNSLQTASIDIVELVLSESSRRRQTPMETPVQNLLKHTSTTMHEW